MAEDQVGLRKEDLRDWAPWTKIFTAFKVALDPKKLLLAAAGLLTMALGWWLLAMIFFAPRSTPPNWFNYKDSESYADKDAAWKAFKQDLKNWNLMYKLAGPTPSSVKEAVPYTVADFADTYAEYEGITAAIEAIKKDTDRLSRVLTIGVDEQGKQNYFELDNVRLYFKIAGVDPPIAKENLTKASKGITAGSLKAAYYNSDAGPNTIKIHGYTLTLAKTGDEAMEEWNKFQTYIDSSKSLDEIENEIIEGKRTDKYTPKALELLRLGENNRYKPSGWLRNWPFVEYRGPNPFMMITGMRADTRGEGRNLPWERGEFFNWFLNDQIPVLLEPLFKLLSPVVYLFHYDAGFWTRLYLLLIVLWTMATWSFFGGAITRMAVVQVARHNEKVGLREALKFAATHYRSYLLAQVAPLVALAVVAVLLFIYGFLEVYLPGIGDIIIAGLALPLVLLLGLVMAVILVGLIGVPLMYATISAEGTDAFDGISRAYSYVYQAPWNYFWYVFLAIVYGAVLVFFVALMGSLTVYLTKWGMSLGTLGWTSREPSYLFIHAPTSYEWRDLLLYQSPEVQTIEVVRPTGTLGKTYWLKEEYLQSFGIHNTIGAWLVAIWIGLLFLFVVGFGYSYFWTASCIIYLLMRRKVDDTDMDEVHLEEEDIDIPYTPPTTSSSPPPGTAATAGSTSLQMVEPPAMRTSPPPETSPPPTSAPEKPPAATPVDISSAGESTPETSSNEENNRTAPADQHEESQAAKNQSSDGDPSS